MTKKDILVVEDDEDIAELIQYNFGKEGFKVEVIEDGLKVVERLENQRPDLLILDIMLPGVNGLDLLKQIRSRDDLKSLPIMMLTAKGEEFDVVLGLELGADDYITKPFSPKELIARTKAVLRRSSNEKPTADYLSLENIRIDKAKHKVQVDGVEQQFTLSEFKLLSALAEAGGRVLTRDQLLGHIAGEGTYVIDRNVDVHIRAVRKKLGSGSKLIETVRGVGYRCRV